MAGQDIRLWQELAEAYGKVAGEHKLEMDDLVNTMLTYAPIFGLGAVVMALEDSHDVSSEEAIDVAMELQEAIVEILEKRDQQPQPQGEGEGSGPSRMGDDGTDT